jgi:hypothetical protein
MINQSLIIATFIGFFTSSAVAFLAFVLNPRNPVNRAWARLSFFVGILSIGWGMLIASNNLSQAEFWLKICFLGGFFVPTTFLDFVYSFLSIKDRRPVNYSYLLSSGFMIAFLLGYIVDIAYKPAIGIYWWGPKFPYHFYVLQLVVSASLGIYLLYKRWLVSHGIMKTQLLYLFVASFLGFASGSTGFLPAYFPILPFGFYPFFLYPLVVAYAIVRYRLMDISIVIRKSLVYTLIIGLFTGIYLSAIFLFGQALQGLAGGAHQVLVLSLIIGFAVAFQPLKITLQKQIDKIFFKEKYNYQKTLKELSQAAASIIELNELLKLISKNIVDRLKIDQMSVYIIDQNTRAYNLKEKTVSNEAK